MGRLQDEIATGLKLCQISSSFFDSNAKALTSYNIRDQRSRKSKIFFWGLK